MFYSNAQIEPILLGKGSNDQKTLFWVTCIIQNFALPTDILMDGPFCVPTDKASSRFT